MRRTYIFKLYHCRKNKRLHQLVNIAGEVYNHLLALQRRFYRLYKCYISLYRLQRHLTKLKKRFLHWRQLGSQALQEIAERIDKGYTLFFQALARKLRRRISPPHFKAIHKYRSFTLKQAGYKLLGKNHIRIGKKTYKFFRSRDIEGEIKTVTIKRDLLGDFYLCFSCEVQKNKSQEAMTGRSAGFDFGLMTFCTSSDGEKIEAPLFFKQRHKEIKQACRHLSRKQKGSGQRKKARFALFRLYRKIFRRRREFHFQLARQLIAKYDILFFEDLDLSVMKKRHGKKISDLGFHAFLQILKGYAEKCGKQLNLINRFEPTTKTCSHCKHVVKELPLKIRVWKCENCNAMHDRDMNAAKNILRVGASTLGLGEIRPTLLAITV